MTSSAPDSIYQQVFEEIEAATEALKDLPLPAAAPPPDARTLPRPAAPGAEN